LKAENRISYIKDATKLVPFAFQVHRIQFYLAFGHKPAPGSLSFSHDFLEL